jgi:hypothetical protein
MSNKLIGFIDTPLQGNRHVENSFWCADNGCFSNRWDPKKWWNWVTKLEPTMDFAACPDVVADWDATRRLFDIWAPQMVATGLPVACVAQDGAQIADIDWDTINTIFIGGSTTWKMSPNAEAIIAEANKQNVNAHVGRVNSLKRIRWAKMAGADSVDGTHLTFHPTQGLADVLFWLRDLETQPTLFDRIGQ